MYNKTFSGKVALVTGGTSGIGKTTAIEFARAGAKVVLTGRREKEGAQVVGEIKKLGGDAAFVRADVAKDADVKAMVDFTVDKFGRLDVAFNNAGVEWKGPLDQATESVALEFAKQNIRINAVAPGVIATEMFDRFAEGASRDQITSMIPVGRSGVTKEIAAAVLYLCSDDAKFTVGTSLVVDGGWVAQ